MDKEKHLNKSIERIPATEYIRIRGSLANSGHQLTAPITHSAYTPAGSRIAVAARKEGIAVTVAFLLHNVYIIYFHITSSHAQVTDLIFPGLWWPHRSSPLSLRLVPASLDNGLSNIKRTLLTICFWTLCIYICQYPNNVRNRMYLCGIVGFFKIRS